MHENQPCKQIRHVPRRFFGKPAQREMLDLDPRILPFNPHAMSFKTHSTLLGVAVDLGFLLF
jgi:hypothetical protein